MKFTFSMLVTFLTLNLSSQEYVNDTTGFNFLKFLSVVDSPAECFRSERLETLIPQREIFNPKKISITDFESLSAYEHFVYAFYYKESYHQICARYGGVYKDLLIEIPAELRLQGEGLRMSDRQENALIENRDSTLILIGECIRKSDKVDDDFKRTIVDFKAFELIPDLIAALGNQKEIKDPYILTTLCLLMRYDYEAFKESEVYKSFYSMDTDGSLKMGAYKNHIPFTYSNYNSIVELATDYYELKSNQPSDFIQIEGGVFSIGQEGHSINPRREVEVKRFQISRYEITNKQFKQFIDATAYITHAEKQKDAFVFRLGLDEFEWFQDSTANWKYPNGVSKGGIEDKMDHPVTCISYFDALAYCKWAKVRLPTIEEWEVASRAGNFEDPYFFGDQMDSIYEYANIWHGKTHLMEYEGEDYLTTSPVGSFNPNPFGIYDIYGNVFEFCSNVPTTFNPFEYVASSRGGSWWCSFHACGFFNSVDIGKVYKEASFSNNGFRVVR